MSTAAKIKRSRGNKQNIEAAFDDSDMIDSIKDLCRSKAEEFRMYGYEDVNYEQVWSCVTDKYMRTLPKVHKIVSDILTLDAQDFMDWLMLGVFKGRHFTNREEISSEIKEG